MSRCSKSLSPYIGFLQCSVGAKNVDEQRVYVSPELFCENFCRLGYTHGFGICSLKLQSLVRTFAIFLPSAFVSGFFYSRVVLSLAKSKQNSSKRHLTVLLLILWLSWVTMNSPYLAYDLFRTMTAYETEAFRNIEDVFYYLDFSFTYVSIFCSMLPRVNCSICTLTRGKFQR